jgi:hypothetical protein
MSSFWRTDTSVRYACSRQTLPPHVAAAQVALGVLVLASSDAASIRCRSATRIRLGRLRGDAVMTAP